MSEDEQLAALARESLLDAFGIVTLVLAPEYDDLLRNALLALPEPRYTVQAMASIIKEYVDFMAKQASLLSGEEITAAQYWQAQVTDWASRHPG